VFNITIPNKPTCKLCISYIGARFAIVLVIGMLIGAVATQFVEFPPSTTMIQTIADQRATAEEVTSLTSRTTKLESDVRHIQNNMHKH